MRTILNMDTYCINKSRHRKIYGNAALNEVFKCDKLRCTANDIAHNYKRMEEIGEGKFSIAIT